MHAPLSFSARPFASRTRRRARFSKGNLFYFAFSSHKKKLSLARVPIIMFKRLFGQPSSSSSSNRNNGNNNTMGSTSSGRAAFDAVDKLKDVRFCFPPSFLVHKVRRVRRLTNWTTRRLLRAFLFSVSLSFSFVPARGV
jgi:hypothetical protein